MELGFVCKHNIMDEYGDRAGETDNKIINNNFYRIELNISMYCWQLLQEYSVPSHMNTFYNNIVFQAKEGGDTKMFLH